jgi:hypothetical protein
MSIHIISEESRIVAYDDISLVERQFGRILKAVGLFFDSNASLDVFPYHGGSSPEGYYYCSATSRWRKVELMRGKQLDGMRIVACNTRDFKVRSFFTFGDFASGARLCGKWIYAYLLTHALFPNGLTLMDRVNVLSDVCKLLVPGVVTGGECLMDYDPNMISEPSCLHNRALGCDRDEVCEVDDRTMINVRGLLSSLTMRAELMFDDIGSTAGVLTSWILQIMGKFNDVINSLSVRLSLTPPPVYDELSAFLLADFLNYLDICMSQNDFRTHHCLFAAYTASIPRFLDHPPRDMTDIRYTSANVVCIRGKDPPPLEDGEFRWPKDDAVVHGAQVMFLSQQREFSVYMPDVLALICDDYLFGDLYSEINDQVYALRF